MDDQRREEAPSETAQAWDSARRLREPVAWTLLVLTAIGLLHAVSASGTVRSGLRKTDDAIKSQGSLDGAAEM